MSSAIGLRELLAKKGKQVDEEIATIIPRSDWPPGLNSIVWYTLSAGGKRIRPVMCLLVAEALDGDIKHALRFAASMELLHTFLLIHDDIEDGDTVRRNKPSAWIEYGLAHAVNCGDYLLAKVFDSICSLIRLGVSEKKVVRLLGETNFAICETGEGQALEINSRNRNDLTEKEYLKLIQKKTGAYLTLPMIGGAIIADASNMILNALRKFGHFIGPAFQIRDDIIDLTKGKGRGEIGCDIREGKRSFLIVHVVSICTPEEKKTLFSILNKPRSDKTRADIGWIIELFEKYKAIEYAEKKTVEMVERGKSAISGLPTELNRLLYTFADFAIVRSQ